MNKKIVNLGEVRARDTVAVLEELLSRAKAGQISGVVVGYRMGPLDHRVGVTGTYREDPVQGLAIAGRVAHVLNKMIDRRHLPNAQPTEPASL